MNHGETHSAAFSLRIQAVELLLAASTNSRIQNSDKLRSAAAELESISAHVDFKAIGVAYAAFGALIRCAATLVEWRAAILSAEPDADRFKRSAKEHFKIWQAEYSTGPAATIFKDAGTSMDAVSSIEHVAAFTKLLSSTPLPIPFFRADMRPPWSRRQSDTPLKEPPPELAVAFVSFQVDGRAASDVHFLTPFQAHDLDIEVRVSRWPEETSTLSLAPISIESAGTYDLPTFTFTKPAGQPPFVLRQQGRAIIKAAQGLYARPFEFRYTAEFLPRGVEQPVAVVGQRSLRIESIDLQKAPLTGFEGLDRKILSARDELRAQRCLNEEDMRSMLILFQALANLAGRSLLDNLYPKSFSEAEFQADVRNDLRRRPEIGSKLEEHPRAAGGITDLSFCGIRLELKVENGKAIGPDDCTRDLEQTVSYVVGTGKRAGILCVLDSSPKAAAPYPAEDGVKVFPLTARDSSVCIVTIVIQGNLARPSALST